MTSEQDATVLYTRGREAKDRGDFAAAERCYREALALAPDAADVWVSLGVVLRRLSRHEESEQCQRKALEIDPDNPVACVNLGNLLLANGDLVEAEGYYETALRVLPDLAEAHNNLGRLRFLRGEFGSAIESFSRALDCSPQYFEALDGLGNSLLFAGEYARSVPYLEHARSLRPREHETRFSLASAYLASSAYPAALNEFEEVLRLKPDFAKAKAGVAAVLERFGQFAKPARIFEEALQASPEEPWIQGYYAQFLLRHGDFDRGWPLYEYRFRTAQHRRTFNRRVSAPLWRGEPLHGQTLLLTAEQGIGDEIMFASVFEEIIAEAGHCIIEGDERLAPLLGRSFPSAEIIGVPRAGNSNGWQSRLEEILYERRDIAFWSPIGSLPLFRRRLVEKFPTHRGYLVACPERTARWREVLRGLGPGPKVGISWRGGTSVTNGPQRSMQLSQLQSLFAQRKARFVSLQYGEARADIETLQRQFGFQVHHWDEAIDDFDETAALCSALDLTISVCTAVVHLNGALGRPVWVMAPFVPEWRYGQSGQSMIWYPSVRMFRQPKSGAWPAVLRNVRHALSSWLEEYPNPDFA